jgi:hypothetical protein
MHRVLGLVMGLHDLELLALDDALALPKTKKVEVDRVSGITQAICDVFGKVR